LRERHSVKWNDGLLSDSLEAVKMSIGYVDKRVTGAEPPAEKAAKPPAMKKSVTLVHQGLFRKGFLNLPPISVPPVALQEVNNGGVVGPSSPSSGCFNGVSQSWNWPVGFDHNGEIVVWEEDEDDYWDGLPLDWAMDGILGRRLWLFGMPWKRSSSFLRARSLKGKGSF
jgi:hypothetical protein